MVSPEPAVVMLCLGAIAVAFGCDSARSSEPRSVTVAPVAPSRESSHVAATPSSAPGGSRGSAPRPLFEPEVDESARRGSVERAVAAAQRGERTRYLLSAVSTTDYGCRCPPFVLSDVPGDGGLPWLMVIATGPHQPALGLATPEDGVYRFTGHFDGRKLTGAQWLEAASLDASHFADPDELRAEAWQTPAPVFVTDSWCFSLTHREPPYYHRTSVERLRAAGRLCEEP